METRSITKEVESQVKTENVKVELNQSERGSKITILFHLVPIFSPLAFLRKLKKS